MKTSKKGYTAVELIVALVVVGGVAAITIPLLSSCIQKSQIGANVDRTVKSIERSYAKTIASNEDKNVQLTELQFDTNGVDVITEYTDKTINSEKIIAQITIDGNGIKKNPNISGHDIYKFNLLNDGKLVPADEETFEFVKNEYRVK